VESRVFQFQVCGIFVNELAISNDHEIDTAPVIFCLFFSH